MEKQLRIYTKKRISKNPFEKFLRRFSMTNWIIITNFIVFILVVLLLSFINEDYIYQYLAIQPNLFFSGYVWTILTSIFMHANLPHLFANMISLFFIGNFVERLIGRKRVFWFYILSGIFAGLFYISLSITLGNTCIIDIFNGCIGPKIFVDPTTYAVGASGAIFALLGLLAILTPNNKVYLIAGPIIAIIIQATLASIFPDAAFMSLISLAVWAYFLFSMFAIFSFNRKVLKFAFPLEMPLWLLPIIAIVPLIIIGLFVTLPIGNTAHLGGLIAGIIYGVYLKRKYPKKVKVLNRMFS